MATSGETASELNSLSHQLSVQFKRSIRLITCETALEYCRRCVAAAADGLNEKKPLSEGDKHNGFAVMYQIMKGGQQTVKDLFDLIKERAGVEDDSHRHGAKTVKLISGFDNQSSLNPLWCTLKLYFQKLLDVQQGFVIRLLELSKEVQRFGDDQFKIHKSVKEKESKTFEAVNLIQTTTTCLQKAKEMYHTRCSELEKMKRDNCSLKELNKMQIRLDKAREEYRHYVSKYENVRVDFEERLTAAAKNFQSLQLNYFEQMKKFLTTYMCNVSNYYQSLLSVSQETNAEIHSVDVKALLTELVATRGTGTERPVPVKFEEPQCSGAHNSFPSSSSEAPVCETATSIECPVHLDGSPFDVDQTSAGLRDTNMFLPSSSRERVSTTSSVSSASSSPMASTAPSISTSHSKTKLNLWLPGRRSSYKSSSSSTRKDDRSSPACLKPKAPDTDSVSSGKQKDDSKAAWINPLFENSLNSPSQKESDVIGAAGSTSCPDSSRKRTLSIGFLKRISKDKKKGPEPSYSCESKDDDEPNPVCSVAAPVNSTANCLPPTSLPEYSNSSDSESDEELDKKINVQIKPLMGDTVSVSASADELREAIGSMTFTPAGNVFSKNVWSAEASTAIKVNRLKPGMVLRPARTGDDKWNNLLFAGAEQRLRPRSTTPTHMISLDRAYLKTESDTNTAQLSSCQANDRDYPSLISSTQEPSPSLRELQGKIPLAVAIIETVHALFKVDGDCIVKVFGSVTVSFPSGCLRVLMQDANAYPLVFSLKNVTRMHSVVYNQDLMRRVVAEADFCHKYEFNMKTLLKELQEHACRTPLAPYYNLEVMRYEVQTEPFVNAPDQMAPLLLHGSWNKKDGNVHLSIRYGYNPQCCLCSPLSNVVFVTDVCGNVQGVQCNSEMSWSHEENRLQFNLSEMSCRRSSSGILRATVHCTSDNVVSAPIMAQFQANDSCLSDAQLELLCKYYKLSLMRRRLLSGKYICEPQVGK